MLVLPTGSATLGAIAGEAMLCVAVDVVAALTTAPSVANPLARTSKASHGNLPAAAATERAELSTLLGGVSAFLGLCFQLSSPDDVPFQVLKDTFES